LYLERAKPFALANLASLANSTLFSFKYSSSHFSGHDVNHLVVEMVLLLVAKVVSLD
jgi:hypothetical protein